MEVTGIEYFSSDQISSAKCEYKVIKENADESWSPWKLTQMYSTIIDLRVRRKTKENGEIVSNHFTAVIVFPKVATCKMLKELEYEVTYPIELGVLIRQKRKASRIWDRSQVVKLSGTGSVSKKKTFQRCVKCLTTNNEVKQFPVRSHQARSNGQFFIFHYGKRWEAIVRNLKHFPLLGTSILAKQHPIRLSPQW